MHPSTLAGLYALPGPWRTAYVDAGAGAAQVDTPVLDRDAADEGLEADVLGTVPATAALTRAAVLPGAELATLPHAATDRDIAALLRWPVGPEETSPRAPVHHAVAAESVGFDLEVCGDHYSPWLTEQGHAP